MAKKKKNRALPLIIMAAVLAVLVVGYIILSSYNAKKEAEETEAETSTVEVLRKETAILTAFSYTVDDGVVSLSYDNEEWVYPGDTTFPIDGDAVTEMVSGLTDIKAVSVVNTENADVDDFGLEEPALTLTVSYSDDTEYTFKFGIVNSFNSYQYMSYTGSDDIYMVESTLASSFNKELNDLYEAEIWTLQNDAVTAEDVTSIVIETVDGESNTIENEDAISTLFDLVYKLDLSTWEDHYADETEMQETYGISESGDRVTLNYTKESSVTNDDGTTTSVDIPAAYTVYFGYEFEAASGSETAEDEAEETADLKFFYTQSGSSVVYSEDKETADDIFEYLSYVPPVEIEADTAAETEAE